MHFLINLPILSLFALSASANVDDAAPQTTTPPKLNDKRDGTAATLTLGPLSDFTPAPPKNPPAPTGSDFVLEAAGQAAEDGVNLFMGPDLQSKMRDTFHDKCGDPQKQDCSTAIRATFDKQQLDLQRRALPLLVLLGWLLAGAISAALVNIFVNGYPKEPTKVAPSYVRLPLSNLPQTTSATTASSIAFATAVNDPKPIGVAYVPDDKGEDPPTITKESDGDVTIHLPKDLADRSGDYMGMHTEGCQRPHAIRSSISQKRDLTDDAIRCIVQAAVSLLFAMRDGPVAELAGGNDPGHALMRPADPGGLQALNQIEQQVAPLQRQVGFAAGEFAVVVRRAYWLAYDQQVGNHVLGTDTRIKKQDMDTSDQGACPTKEYLKCSNQVCKGTNGRCGDGDFKNCECSDDENQGNCPSDDLIPECENCGGDAGGQKCVGGGGIKAGCNCWNDNNPEPFQAFDSEQEFTAAQDNLMNLPDAPIDPDDTPECGDKELRKRDGSTGTDLPVETKLFTNFIDKSICPGGKFARTDRTGAAGWMKYNLNIGNADPNIVNADSYKGWNFEFDFVPVSVGAKCAKSCADIFKAFLGNSQCSPDSHSMAASGVLDVDCGRASYQITKP